jgi:CheY-like chemotaxis protein
LAPAFREAHLDPLRNSVMLVEDEPILRLILIGMLEDAGYRVTPVESGESAVAMLETESANYSALLTDIRLARHKDRLTGWDVARRARELNPDLRVIYMSGDSGVDWASCGVPKSVLVTKPFTSAHIVAAVSQLQNDSG